MKVKTQDLTGPALDWAVAKCEYDELAALNIQYPQYAAHFPRISPSTDWAQGGPIIERENMTIMFDEDGQTYSAHVSKFRQRGMSNRTRWRNGPTPLIAAMRCYCCSKFGDVVDIPEELCQQQKS